MAAPKLRFKEFDGSWKEVTLKNCITSIDSGWSPQCESYPANSNEWGVLKTTSVDWSGFNSCFNKKLPLELTPRKEIEVKPLDILVTRAGPTERVGVVAVVPHNVRSKLMISDKLIRLKADNENNPEFLGISLSSVKCQNQLQSKTSGLAKSQTNISQKILCDVSLMTPAKAEQTKIASFLSAVDEKISQLTQKHQLLSQYKQGMMQKLFSQQIRFKADDGSAFGEWESILVKDIFDVTRGQVLAVSNTVAVADTDYKYPVFSSQTKQKGLMGFYKEYLFEDALTWTTDGANAGDVNFRKGKFYCTNVCGVLLSKKGYANLCIAEILNRVTRKYVSYVGNPKLMNNVMSVIPITIPRDIEEQTKIANFLSTIDQKIEVVAQQIEQAKQWKKGLLQQMFV